MFVCNVKLNRAKIFKIIIILVIIISLLFLIYSKIVKSQKQFVNDEVIHMDIAEIQPENYTSILKSCHENIEPYLGKKIKFSGFIYRLYDFSENQFVLGREMIVGNGNSQNQAQVVVVGFLCNSSEASSFNDNDWVEIEGTITKGYYHSEIPVLEISKIQKASCPENPYVYPPDNSYVETEKL